ncbi:SDR family NAD(P)-dependent oxidoreductase [Sphingobium boeckii]|uniref:Meso-butanediol dehydrogenase/(S,S)-butanediol dehydrogenase/diacetyl reductase n=1 Tax=Sphingobium boeckii TaxID=1082345 RepID=A0A7W9AL58_9SPHN|nr:SDR family NAD(P)-dependent oxidoreductase [Sphingobium boeckii]MBB5687704.1 meso-butanediol dehydrogenase/(S,S)-butanediol dehydrogenase/diacetyl reductase [Sphingobium boeckii]
MKPLAGKTAVITGSGRKAGLGEAIALRLAEDGANIVLSDIGASRDAATPDSMIGLSSEMEEIAQAIKAKGVAVSAMACDVRRWDEVQALADHAVAEHGSLDIWVNNAGIGYIMKPLLEVTEHDWTAVIDVNLTGSFFGLRAAAERMIAAGKGGRIINIASQAAKSGFPCAQAYTASKHGLVGLARSAAIELGSHGITVNNVCPNHVTTGLGAWQNSYFAERQGKSLDQYMADMAARIPMGRPGIPQDTANAVAFLCQDAADYITAESLNVSGGEEPH